MHILLKWVQCVGDLKILFLSNRLVMLKQTVSVMVRDYREGSKTVKGGGFRIESVAKHANVKKSFKSVVSLKEA